MTINIILIILTKTSISLTIYSYLLFILASLHKEQLQNYILQQELKKQPSLFYFCRL